MQPEALAQLREFVTQQMRNGVSEPELREMIKKEGGWTDDDLAPVFSNVQAPTPVPTSPSQPVDIPVHRVYAPDSPPVGWGSAQPAVHEVPGMVIPEQKDPTHHRSGIALSVIVGFVVLLVGGAVASGAYMYVQKTGWFANAPYTEENFLSGVLGSVAGMQSVRYAVTGSLVTQPRDADARPFEYVDTPERAAYRAAYARDIQRFEHVNAINDTLRYYSYDPYATDWWYGDTQTEPAASYPATLQELEAAYISEQAKNTYAYNMYYDDTYPADPTETSFPRDPSTNTPYSYTTVDNNSSYELTVTFETYDAVREVQGRAYYIDESPLHPVRVEGKTVTFTDQSSGYYYLPEEPPLPFLVQLGESARLLPPEISGQLTLGGGNTNLSDPTLAQWEFNLDGAGDLGDMAYKFAFDVRKVDENYYFRLRNMPGIFLTFMPIPKDTWVRISPSDAQGSDDPFSSMSFLSEYAEELPEAEEEYRKAREATALFLRDVIRFAQEERVLYFKTEPILETIDGRDLYRYDIGVRKDAVVPFMTKVIDAANANEYIAKEELFNDTGLLEYLKSDEYGRVFAYVDANTSFTVHVDKEGTLARVESGMRVVPPDTATQLAQKQFHTSLLLTLADINVPFTIEAPVEATPLKDIIASMEQNMRNSSLGQARTRAMIATVKSEIQSGMVSFLLACDESETALQTKVSEQQSEYVRWGTPLATSCGPSGMGTFSITAESIDTLLCGNEPLRATVTESGVVWMPERCGDTLYDDGVYEEIPAL